MAWLHKEEKVKKCSDFFPLTPPYGKSHQLCSTCQSRRLALGQAKIWCCVFCPLSVGKHHGGKKSASAFHFLHSLQSYHYHSNKNDNKHSHLLKKPRLVINPLDPIDLKKRGKLWSNWKLCSASPLPGSAETFNYLRRVRCNEAWEPRVNIIPLT